MSLAEMQSCFQQIHHLKEGMQDLHALKLQVAHFGGAIQGFQVGKGGGDKGKERDVHTCAPPPTPPPQVVIAMPPPQTIHLSVTDSNSKENEASSSVTLPRTKTTFPKLGGRFPVDHDQGVDTSGKNAHSFRRVLDPAPLFGETFPEGAKNMSGDVDGLDIPGIRLGRGVPHPERISSTGVCLVDQLHPNGPSKPQEGREAPPPVTPSHKSFWDPM